LTSTIKKTVVILGVVAVAAAIYWAVGDKKEDTRVVNDDQNDKAAQEKDALELVKNDLGQKMLADKLARLEGKVSAMEIASLKKESCGDNTQDEKTQGETQEMPPPPDLEKLLSKSIERFENQPYDRQWAEAAETSFHKELSEAASEIGMRLESVECKSTDCMAVVEFENYEAVKQRTSKLAMQPFSVNCGLQITNPEPENRDAPYHVKVFFVDCEKQPAG
jgi:hypothetical protein